MMKLKLFFFGLLFFSGALIHAQSDSTRSSRSRPEPVPLRDKIVWGGNLALQLGTQSVIDISPIVGYKLTERLVPGVGLTYRHIRWRNQGFAPISANYFGVCAWSRFYFVPQLFAHIEYEALNGEWSPYNRPGYRYFLTTPFIGGGYSQGNGFVSSYVMLLYILNYGNDSPYPIPLVFRVGFTVGI
jgi:hypothetical protein